MVHLSFHKKTVASVVAAADQAQSSPSNFLLDLDSNCCYKTTNRIVEDKLYFCRVWVNFKTNLLKVNSVQEACAKCFAVHKLKFEILQIT